MLPFTVDQFLAVFAHYHAATWPFVYVVHLAAILILFHLLRSTAARKDASLVLSFLGVIWIWMGIAYHWLHFAAVNPAAKLFGAGFVLQGLWLLFESRRPHRIELSATPTPVKIVTGALVIYALAVYPLLGNLAGHTYPAAPMFGLPCPSTIFTFGMLLLLHDNEGRPLRRLYVLPALWSIIGTYAAINLSIVQDIALPVAAVLTLAMMRFQPKRSPIQLRFQR